MSDYPYIPLYYTTPILVKYLDQKSRSYCYGIAYHDQLCTHDGQVIPLTTCIIEAQISGVHWDDAIIECNWRDLNALQHN